MRTEPDRTSTARISITVTDFHEIGRENSCSRADIELIDTGDGKVRQSGINATIEVMAEVFLEFGLYAASGDRHGYMPVGIGFKAAARDEASKQAALRQSEECGSHDLMGRAAFPMRTIAAKGDATRLTVLDANPEERMFEFSLVIQRSDGALGVIDPKIWNRRVVS